MYIPIIYTHHCQYPANTGLRHARSPTKSDATFARFSVAPFAFTDGKTRRDYRFTGREAIDIPGLSGKITPRMKVMATIRYPDGTTAPMPLMLMILTADEVAYFTNGGILPYVLRNLVAA